MLTSFHFCWKFLGLPNQPKYGHLKELHRAIKLCEKPLVSADPIITSLGAYQQVRLVSYFSRTLIAILRFLLIVYFLQAHVYSSESEGCAAFLSNFDSKSSARVVFNNMHYNLPPWSISILPDCRNVVFNTAKVSYIHRMLLFPFFAFLMLVHQHALFE